MEATLKVLDRVRINIPYTGGNGEAYRIGFVSEVVGPVAGGQLYSVAPYKLETACAGRVATIRYYYTRFVDFTEKELRARRVVG